jgi:hypothetical protein
MWMDDGASDWGYCSLVAVRNAWGDVFGDAEQVVQRSQRACFGGETGPRVVVAGGCTGPIEVVCSAGVSSSNR